MLVNHSHILEVRELKDSKIILCYIQIANRSVEYYHGQASPHNTQRWMQAEDWAKFDAYLGKMLTKSLDKLLEHSFQLNASVHVRVTKSQIPVDALKRCIKDAPETWGSVMALEFFIEYKEFEVQQFTQLNNTDPCVSDILTKSQEEEDQNHEYEPPFVSSQQDGAHVPYTPSPKTKPKLRGGYTSETPDDEAYSPKPVPIDSSPNSNNESPSHVPTYKPSRMRSIKQGKSQDSIITTQIAKDKNGHRDESKNDRYKRRDRSRQTELFCNDKNNTDQKLPIEHKLEAREKDKRRQERKATSQHDDDINYDEKKLKKTQKGDGSDKNIKEKSHKKINDADENTSEITFSPTPHEKRKRNLVNASEDSSSIQLRRSSRSPTKPKRFIDESMNRLGVHSNRSSSRSPKRSKKKSNKFNEDLFGSDDEDEKLDADFATNKSTKIKTTHLRTSREKTSTESSKKKRKHTSPLDCSSEKKGMDSWLGKKLTGKQSSSTTNTSSKHKEPKSSTLSSTNVKKRKSSNDSSPLSIVSTSPAPMAVAYLSKEEIEENMLKEKQQLENNSKIKEMLKQMAGPTPEKVETLNIKDLSLKDIQNSFELYKPQLDEIFRRSMKKAHQIKGYEGINSYMVMSLIDMKKPLDMMNILQDAYEPDCEGIPTYTSIFANAMMPEWIIRLFMDKHKLTREEAIKHVKAQDEYQLHLKSLIENPIAE